MLKDAHTCITEYNFTSMSAPKQLCVIIPVHKTQPLPAEVASLKACARWLKAYDCYLLHPKGMPVDAYQAIFPALKSQPVSTAWLSSVHSYNHMKLDLRFYRLFENYQYLLTYELDAYIFSDRLADYHAFSFDYIGAPLFEGYGNATADAAIIAGGNSGFSVRKIESCITVLNTISKYQRQWKIFHLLESNLGPFRQRIHRSRLNKNGIFLHHDLSAFFKGKYFHEDMVWSQAIPALFPFFKVADTESAREFSFEVNPEKLYRLNGQRLPLGCHAWTKFPDFWENFIPEI